MIKFNEKIYNLRKEKNITQEELAAKLSVSIEELIKWETAECEPEIRSAIEIAKFFEISLDELFNVDIKKLEDDKINNEKLSEIDPAFIIIMSVTLLLIISVILLYFFVVK